MFVKQISVSNFRGFEALALTLRKHVLLLGTPGAGRSDLLEAVARPLDAEGLGRRTVTELDFHNKLTSTPIVIEIVLGDLGAELEQQLIDELEIWNTDSSSLIATSENPQHLQTQSQEWVVRLAYRADWNQGLDRADEAVYFPKFSDQIKKSFRLIRRTDLISLNFRRLQMSTGRLFDLGGRSNLRSVVQAADGDDFEASLQRYVEGVSSAAGLFSDSKQLAAALELVFKPLRPLLALEGKTAAELIQFEPEGGALSGLLRSLGPSLDLGDPVGSLPVQRHGSTVANVVRVAEALGTVSGIGPILTADDFGDGLDPAAAAHLASTMRNATGQVWIATRYSEVAEVFDPSDVLRLSRDDQGRRISRQVRRPSNKQDYLAFKHWYHNLLPALTYAAVIIVEGPHDLDALNSLALKINAEQGDPLPATFRALIISAGDQGAGGSSKVPKLAAFAKELGLRVVGIIDGDKSTENDEHFKQVLVTADAGIRLPEGFAIERAIIHGVSDDNLREAIQSVAGAIEAQIPANWATLAGPELAKEAIAFLKRGAGHHAAYINALPIFPEVAVKVLQTALEAANGKVSGKIQLEA